MKPTGISACYIVPGQPHILLAKEKSPQWHSLYESYQQVRAEISKSDADLILYFSTQWLSVLGYMVQGDPKPEGVHVDPNWHEFGSMNYQMRIDTSFAEVCAKEILLQGHCCKLVNYKGFPIDTGSIVAQKLLNPDNRFPIGIVSCSIYGDRDETIKIGQAVRKALQTQKKKAIAVVVSNLSNRFFTHEINPREDMISSRKDDEWNLKILEMLKSGSLADVVQASAAFATQGNADMGGKAFWWLAGLTGLHNLYSGQVFDYKAVWGTGNAIVGLYPPKNELEIVDEGEQNFVASESKNFLSTQAPEAVGPYPHARCEGDMLFLSGIGPRKKGSQTIPGVTLDTSGNILHYDIIEQTHSVMTNVKTILEECGSSLAKVIDCQVFLTDMKKDFATFNRIYGEYFNQKTGPTRTTIEVGRLPTPIAVELKVIAKL